MKMEKRKFRIGELAKLLEVERFVIRFWEKEFSIKSHRSEGGQRFYDEKDYEKFQQIKILLYEKGFTIAGARKQIEKNPELSGLRIQASQKTTVNEELVESQKEEIKFLSDQILKLQKQLIKLKEIL